MIAFPPLARAAQEPDPETSRTLIDDLLAEQQELTAVETFSRAHEDHALRGLLYRHLLPASPPAPGQQYAFEVKLDQCSGCKACVSACHSLNGLDDDETWRAVGMLTGDPADDVRARRGAAAFQQHVTTACHHCVDPACLNGCPVLAYDKDPLTGIVRHLDDQCIGCQYCVMMCPYEVPQYSRARGIVRKCDMCSSRLAVGEAPACVQACPTSAIEITVVEQAKVRGKFRVPKETLRMSHVAKKLKACAHDEAFALRNSFLPAAPNPAITLPATRFVTQRTLPEKLFAGDHAVVRRSDSHRPLVVLLVLSQLAVGSTVGALFVHPAQPLLVGALASGAVAMVAGSLHLGQPRKAWRSFLGWRKSWFSREVIAFGAFLALLSARVAIHPATSRMMGSLPALLGLVTVTCSAMIYVDTRRDFWNGARCFASFFGTTLLLGTAATLASLTCAHLSVAALTRAVVTLAVATLAKLASEQRIFAHLVHEETPAQTPLNKTARLLAGELNAFVRARIAVGLLGGLFLPMLALLQYCTNPAAVAPLALVGLGLCLAGELIERYLFFTAVVTHKMPGGLTS